MPCGTFSGTPFWSVYTVPEIRLPNRTEAVASAVEFVEAEAARAGWSTVETTRAVLALSEAVGNAVEHGGGDLRVRCRSSPAALRLEVVDGGSGPSPRQLDRAALPSDTLAQGGRGLYIIKTVSDAVSVAEGTVVMEFTRA